MQILSDRHRFTLSGAEQRLPVLADHERLAQVLTNLLENAIKYSPHGGDIEIRVGQDGNQVVFSVRDHGIGIPQDQVKHIFERFYRAGNVSSEHYGGLGLGLHISREIIQRHEGQIWVESREGEGSTFSFCLPLAESTAMIQS
jgi:signal transduction histidine kinase